MQRVKVSFIVIEPEFEIANLIDPVVQKTSAVVPSY